MDFLDRGRSPIEDWLEDRREVPVKAKAKIDRVLLQLSATPLWVRPLASNLDDYPGIVEIRILYLNVQYRLLGFRGPFDQQFTLLLPAKEQGDTFNPRNAPEMAQNRMEIVKSDPRGRTREHRFGKK